MKNTSILLWASIVFFFNPTILFAQDFQLTFKANTVNTFGSKDFWNINVVSGFSTNKTVTLHASVKSSGGALLVEASSGSVTLANGFNSLTPYNVTTASIQYYQSGIQQADQSAHSFPAGNYTYCIDIIDPSNGDVKTTSCTTIEIKVLNPPILVYPGNGDLVEEKNPLLTWLPPSPLADISNIRYNLTLVELYPDQQAGDGVLRNQPKLYQTGITGNTLQYPFNAPTLEYNKSYAWQIEATDVNQVSYGATEIWYFKLGIDSLPQFKRAVDQSYIDIKMGDVNSTYYAIGELKIKYETKQYPLALTYKILTMDGQVIGESPSELMALTKDNRYDIPVDQVAALKHKQQYILLLQNDRNEEYRLNFQYIDPIRIK